MMREYQARSYGLLSKSQQNTYSYILIMQLKHFSFSIVLVLFFVQSLITLHAQQLKVGDRLPDGVFSNLLNSHASALRLSEIKTDLILLDFWGHRCLTCIQAFPKLDSLQKQFKERLQIIAVNQESLSETSAFLKKRKISTLSFPMLAGDTILGKLFPQNFHPWHVWIDRNRTVRYITHGYSATYENISAFLAGQELEVEQLSYSPGGKRFNSISEFFDKNDFRMQTCSYIALCSAENHVGTVDRKARDGKPNWIARECYSVVNLLKDAFEERDKYDFRSAGSVVVKVSDSSKYFKPKNSTSWDVWKVNNSYTYELILPESKSNDVYKVMQDDLVRYFNLNVSVQQRMVKCFVLVRTSQIDKIKADTSLQKRRYIEGLISFQNRPIRSLIKHLTANLFTRYSQPVADGTGYYGNVDLLLNTEPFADQDMEGIRQELKRYDLDLIEQDWITDVLVIEERKE